MKFLPLAKLASLMMIAGAAILNLSPARAAQVLPDGATGCAILNGSQFKGSTNYFTLGNTSYPNLFKVSATGFNVGDVITATTTKQVDVDAIIVDFTTSSYLQKTAVGVNTVSYTVTAQSVSHQLGVSASGDPASGDFINVSCVSASGNIQTSAAQVQGLNSQAAINDILDQVIPGTQSNTFNSVTSSGNGVAVLVAPGQQVSPVADAPQTLHSDSPYRMFMAGRYTHASGAETGDQFNGLFGLSRRLGEQATIGLFGGYEGFNYTDGTPASLGGNGETLGGFVAGTFNQRLKLDARVYTTFMSYSINTGAATGNFGAQRLGTTATASYELGTGPVSFAPFVRGSGLFEWQNAYTNSAATAVAAQSLSQGTLAPGLRLSRTTALANGSTLTPYLAGEADYVLGATTLAGFNGTTGLSGKVSAGAKLLTAKGWSLGLDASYGGIGSSINSQSLMGTLNVPF